MLFISFVFVYYEIMALKIMNINKTFRNHLVLNDFNLEIPSGELVSVWGPNGSGKTTLLNIVAGIYSPDKGKIMFEDKKTGDYKTGCVFQNYKDSLFPWLTVKENISFPLFLKGASSEVCEKEVKNLLQKFSININLEAYPYELSGGQQQLAAVLRGLIIHPDIYLLDEPFSSLDYQTGLAMLQICILILKRQKLTALFVSHDIDEAILFSTTIVVFCDNQAREIKTYKNDLPFPRAPSMMLSPSFINIKKKILDTFAQNIINSH